LKQLNPDFPFKDFSWRGKKIENLSAEMSAKKEPAVKNEKSLFL